VKLEIYHKSGTPIPTNKGANRKLDCTVIKYVHQSNIEDERPAYDTVRSAFTEGNVIYPGSFFTDRLHIEICVLNPDMIKGYFLPRPIDQFNPFLKTDFDISNYRRRKKA
jgi:hypothetical protein